MDVLEPEIGIVGRIRAETCRRCTKRHREPDHERNPQVRPHAMSPQSAVLPPFCADIRRRSTTVTSRVFRAAPWHHRRLRPYNPRHDRVPENAWAGQRLRHLRRADIPAPARRRDGARHRRPAAGHRLRSGDRDGAGRRAPTPSCASSTPTAAKWNPAATPPAASPIS